MSMGRCKSITRELLPMSGRGRRLASDCRVTSTEPGEEEGERCSRKGNSIAKAQGLERAKYV